MSEISYELHFNDRVVKTFQKRENNFWNVFKKNTKNFPKKNLLFLMIKKN